MISLDVGVQSAPMHVLASHDHFRDMNRMFWEWRTTHTYTDLELICQDGRLAAHSAVLWKLMSELELELMMVDGETQILLLPGFTVDEVISAMEETYACGAIGLFCRLLSLPRERWKKQERQPPQPPTLYTTDLMIQFQQPQRQPQDTTQCKQPDDQVILGLKDSFEPEEEDEEEGDEEAAAAAVEPPPPPPPHTRLEDLDFSLDFEEKPKRRYRRSKTAVRSSARLLHTKPFECEHCSYTAHTSLKLALHQRARHLGQHKYACNRCAFQCDLQKVYKDHMRLEHHLSTGGSEKKVYTCAHCTEFCCTNLKMLDQHIIDNHKNVRKFHCEECSYSSNYLNNFRRHQKAHQGIPGNYLCPYCPKSFYVDAKLRSHLLVHTDDKNFVCDECAAKFKRKDDLKVHMRIHLPEEVRAAEKAKKLTKVCETCGKKFEKNWKLKRHMVVHTKDGGGGGGLPFSDQRRWQATKTEAVPAEEQKFIVLEDSTKFVSTDGKYVTAEAKFVQDRIVFNQIQFADV